MFHVEGREERYGTTIDCLVDPAITPNYKPGVSEDILDLRQTSSAQDVRYLIYYATVDAQASRQPDGR